MEDRLRLYIGILLISIATLSLEVLQVRIFSVMLWHHLAYMVITITLLGFGAAGAYVAIRGTGNDEQARQMAGWSALLSSLTAIIGFAVVARIPLDTYMQDSVLQLGFIFLYYAFLVVPYFFMGLTIIVLLSRFTQIVHRLYFWNLLGSAIGCVVFLIFLLNLGGEGSIFASAAVAALAAAPIFSKKKMMVASFATAIALLLLIPLAERIVPVMPAPSKALGAFFAGTPNLKHESSEWDPIARIDVVSSPAFSKGIKYHDAEVKKIFTIDGDAFTFFYGLPKPAPELDIIGETLYSSAYFHKNKPKVAIIGLGGGTDIVTALHHEAKQITGVEINKAMINAAMVAFDEEKFHPYKNPKVQIVHEEGRSFLRRVEEKYDIIQMSGVDTWSALASGAYVLSENYLYTKEAFHEYFDHMDDNGLLSMIRWIFDPPRECLRLVTSQTDVLMERGVQKPWNHFVVLKQGLLASVVAKMRPFSKREIESLKRKLADIKRKQMARRIDDKEKQALIDSYFNIEILYAPGDKGNNAFYRFFEALKENKADLFMNQYPFKLSSVDDDRPFFFEFYKWRDTFGTSFGKGGYLVAARPVGYIILILSLLQAFFFGCLFILAPLWRFRKSGLMLDNSWRMIVYFAALGMGFMFVEVALMQRFVLFLGHPTYSITVTLFALLTFSGIGSMIAGKLEIDQRKLILYTTLAVAIMVTLYALILTPLFNAMLGLPLTARMIISVVLLAPIGTLMGMPFPTGLAYVRRGGAGFVPWAFGINGVASVTASILCIILAIFGGFRLVLALAVVIYAVGGLIMSRLSLVDTGD